jgi:hypothetical protein
MSEHPLSGQLLSAEQLNRQLSVALRQARSSVSLGSAYLKVAALEWVAANLSPGVPAKILVRWQPQDLLDGASDAEAYELATSRGWTFLIQQRFHGKVYLIPECALFVGSTNLTSRGLHLYGDGNDEINVRADLSSENTAFVKSIFQEAVTLNQELYLRIKKWLDSNEGRPPSSGVTPHWPQDIRDLLTPVTKLGKLLVAECFQTDGAWVREVRDAAHPGILATERDLSLLGLGQKQGLLVNTAVIAERIRETKIYDWLYDQLSGAPGRELYFGALTAALHSSLLDDPTPYRSEVKILLSNLLGWVELSGVSEIQIDRPNYSQRVSLRLPVE